MFEYNLDFDFMVGHCTFIKNMLKNERKELQEIYKKATNGMSDEQKYIYYEHYGDEQYYIEDLFPSIQWAAMYVASYNLFEKTLNDICKSFKQNSESKVDLKDLKGQGIQRVKIYLNKIHNIIEPFSTSNWEEIKKHSKLRNVLAHTSGDLDLTNKNHQEVYEISKNISNIKIKYYNEISKSAHIEIKEQLVFDAISNYQKFVREVVIVLRQNKRANKKFKLTP